MVQSPHLIDGQLLHVIHWNVYGGRSQNRRHLRKIKCDENQTKDVPESGSIFLQQKNHKDEKKHNN